jgi:regulation of enolase protein 1 (concanavalin A-like superfamily)
MAPTRLTLWVPGLAVLLVGLAGGAEKPGRWLEGWGDVRDPAGDCKVEQKGGKLTIRIPGKPHDLSAELNQVNAPTVLGEVDGDFIAEVRVTGPVRPGGRALNPQRPPYNGAGLLVWVDAKTFLRLERASILRQGQPAPYVNFELRQDGKMASSFGAGIPDQDASLRLERRGDQLRAYVSPDGERWSPLKPLTAALPEHLSVGVAAVNTASDPFTANLEGFAVFQKLPRSKP